MVDVRVTVLDTGALGVHFSGPPASSNFVPDHLATTSASTSSRPLPLSRFVFTVWPNLLTCQLAARGNANLVRRNWSREVHMHVALSVISVNADTSSAQLPKNPCLRRLRTNGRRPITRITTLQTREVVVMLATRFVSLLVPSRSLLKNSTDLHIPYQVYYSDIQQDSVEGRSSISSSPEGCQCSPDAAEGLTCTEGWGTTAVTTTPNCSFDTGVILLLTHVFLSTT